MSNLSLLALWLSPRSLKATFLVERLLTNEFKLLEYQYVEWISSAMAESNDAAVLVSSLYSIDQRIAQRYDH